MPDNLKLLIDDWGLKGVGVGLIIGFVFEVFLIRNNSGDTRWFVSILSVVAMGLMGWLSFDIARGTFPSSLWKPTIWTTISTANTWWFARFAISGQMFTLITAFAIPEKLQKCLRPENDK